MFFKQIVHEDLGCASYMVGSTETGRCAVVDPRWEIEPYLENAAAHGLVITHIIETHNHADHVSGHGRLSAATGAEICVHRDANVAYAHRQLGDGDVIDLDDVKIRVLHTPGHRPEHIVLAVEDTSRGDEPWMLLTGDSVFIGDVARPDLAIDGKQGAAQLYRSLHDKILHLPDYVEIFPAHVAGSLCGRVTSVVDSTTLGYERRYNEGLRFENQDEFVSFMNEHLPPRPPNMSAIVEHNQGPLQTENEPAKELGLDDVNASRERGGVVLDARPSDDYVREHIPGSISVPVSGSQFGIRVGFVLPSESSLIIVARNAEEAQVAANALRVVAYDNLVGYMLFADWKAAGRETASMDRIEPAELAGKIEEGQTVNVLDVREADEWEEGHIRGATFIPYRELESRLSEVPTGAPLAVTCNAGQRSVLAASLLERAGFKNLLNLDHGMTGWHEAALPTVTDGK